MKKPILLIIAVLLSCISGMLAQNVWDNSACLYQSNMTEVILRTNISTGTIIFYTIDEELFLNKFNDAGDPTLEEPLSLGIGLNGEKVFNITNSANNTFLIGWKEADNLKLQKFDVNGNAEWTLPISMSANSFTDYYIKESVLMITETQINLIVNFADFSQVDNIVHYQVNLSNNTPQVLEPVVIYEGDYVRFLNGISTSEGITLMWGILNENKLAVYKNGVISEVSALFYPNWVAPRNETGKIIELNATTTVYALKSRGYFDGEYGNLGIFIYSQIDSTLTNIYFESAVMDIYKLADNEFLAVTMSSNSMLFTKYDEFGNVISTTEAYSPFQSTWWDDELHYDIIKSMDSQITNNNLKIAMAGVHHTDGYDYSSKLAIYDYNLETEDCSVVDHYFSANEFTEDCSEFVLLQPNGVSLLSNSNYDLYNAYQQYYYDYQENLQPLFNPYEICKNYLYKISDLQSFPWQNKNMSMMRHAPNLLIGNINENAELEYVSPIKRWAAFYKLHDFGPDSYALHYAFFSGRYLHQQVRLYKEDGSISIFTLNSGSGESSAFSSFSDVTNGNGWFVYEDDEYNFHKIENNNLADERSQPFYGLNFLRLIAMENNYLITRVGNEFRLTKIDNEGNIASGWEQLGENFTSDFDTSNENAQLRSYQNKLIFSYCTGEEYKLFIIDPLNLDETVAYSLLSNSNVCQKEFIIGNRFYFIHNYNNNLTMHSYDLENDFAQVWAKVIADNVRSNFAIKKLDNRFVIAYPQGEEGNEKVYLRTVSFRGNSDQYEDGYALPLNWETQYEPSITVADNNSVYVNRIENNSKNIPGVFTDLIDLSYFVPNSSEDVAPMLAQISNYPNPFNPETTISYALPQTGKVKIDVYNIKGQKVKTLVNEHKAAGQHSVVWKGTDDNNKQVASGVYLYKMKSGKFSTTNKMILMK